MPTHLQGSGTPNVGGRSARTRGTNPCRTQTAPRRSATEERPTARPGALSCRLHKPRWFTAALWGKPPSARRRETAASGPGPYHSSLRNSSKAPGRTKSSLPMAQRLPNTTSPGIPRTRAPPLRRRLRAPADPAPPPRLRPPSQHSCARALCGADLPAAPRAAGGVRASRARAQRPRDVGSPSRPVQVQARAQRASHGLAGSAGPRAEAGSSWGAAECTQPRTAARRYLLHFWEVREQIQEGPFTTAFKESPLRWHCWRTSLWLQPESGCAVSWRAPSWFQADLRSADPHRVQQPQHCSTTTRASNDHHPNCGATVVN